MEILTPEPASGQSTALEMMFLNILKYSVDGIVITDETGTILHWNQAQEKIVNIKAEDAIGKKIWDIQYAAAPTLLQTQPLYENLRSGILSFLETGQAHWAEKIFEQSFATGEKTVVMQSVNFPMKTEKGFMMASIVRNITELKELEQKNHEKEVTRLKARQMELEIETRKRELTSMAIHCANKNQALGQIRDNLKVLLSHKKIATTELIPLIKKIENNLAFDKDWETFKIHFEQVHPSFFDNLKTKFPSVTTSDLKLCAYLKIGLSHKEIARITNMTFDGVKSAKFRLKKKFSLDKNQSLTHFIASE